ncbi:MAG: hypothetical protein WC362_09475 [Methanoregula sp.]|jgi:hypothetical protein
MQRSLIIGLCLIVCAALLGAGCISNPGTGNVSATGTDATVSPANISLAPLALGPADVPAGSTLTSARQKSADEVSTLAKDLGWQQGYVIIYSTPANSTGGPALITQTLTVYSKKSMADIVALVDSSERQQKGLVFSRLALPATGADTIAFSAAPVTVTPTLTTTGGMAVPAQGTGTSTPAEGYSEVIFGKGNILEVIRMSGPGTQYDTLKALAETAYAKSG